MTEILSKNLSLSHLIAAAIKNITTIAAIRGIQVKRTIRRSSETSSSAVNQKSIRYKNYLINNFKIVFFR